MKPAHIVCICLVLAGTLVLAQFGAKPPTDEANWLPVVQEARPGGPPNLFQMPQGGLSPRAGPGHLGRLTPGKLCQCLG